MESSRIIWTLRKEGSWWGNDKGITLIKEDDKN